MSAVVEYQVQVFFDAGPPHVVALINATTRPHQPEIGVVKEVVDALLDVRTYRIEITRSES